MERELEGSVVLVTGAASGIGRATAERFARVGASLAVIDLHEENLASLVEILRMQSVPVSSAVADLSVEKEAQHAVREVLACHGKVDVMFANVGLLLAK